ncbi:MAG: glycoside hydrolase family 30 protein [Solirubrobacteraceae bacterium]
MTGWNWMRHLLTLAATAMAGLACCVQAAAGAGPVARAASTRVLVTQTTQDLSQRIRRLPARRFSPATRPRPGQPVVEIDDRLRRQKFFGAGGGMTDSSAWLIWTQLPPAQRDELMKLLFSPSGAHLSFLRVPIGASDYTYNATPYSYDDLPPGATDPQLTHFSVAHDESYILPALGAARKLNPRLYLQGVPWSPPGWMKTNDALDNIDHVGALRPQYYGAFANYFVRFLQAYAARGVPVNGVATQDEPNEPNPYPGMQLTAAQEALLARRYLRPALRAADLPVDLFGWDLSWGPLKPENPLVSASAQGALSGLAWHCYFGSPRYMARVHAAAPHSVQIVDECSSGTNDILPTSELLIASARNWASAVAMWNLALLPGGGPAQALGYGCAACSGMVTIDPRTQRYKLSRDYWQLAQFSRFVQPGAVRVQSPNFVSYALGGLRHYQTVITPGLDDVAFVNPDGSRVLFVYNNSPKAISFAVRWRGSSFTYRIPGHATTTLRWR